MYAWDMDATTDFRFFRCELQTSRLGHVLTITFNDPGTRNSLSLFAARELAQILSRLESMSVNGLIFRAEGRVFCSGGNLADYHAMTTPSEGHQVNREIAEILRSLQLLAIPTVCCVDGDCFGGGLELLSAFDWVIASPGCLFGFWQRRIGLSFGWGGGARLARRLGLAKLKQCALRAVTLAAPEAFAFGLIDQLTLQSKLPTQAQAKLDELMGFSMQPIASLKAWSGLVDEREAEMFEALWWNPDHRGALKGFAK